MTLAVGALAAAVLAAGAPPPAPRPAPAADQLDYALPALRAPCVSSPCAGVLVADLGLELGEPGGARAGAARLLFADRFYLGVSVDESRRALSLETARWDLALEHRDRGAAVDAEYRGPRLRLRARAEDFDPRSGDGQRLDIEVALRLGPDLELFVAALDDGRAAPATGLEPAPTAALALGALWQRGPRFELGGRAIAATLSTPGGLELDRNAVELEATYQAGRWRLDGALAIDDLAGRFERRELAGEARLDYRVTARLVAHAEAGERHELDLGSIERRGGAGLTFYARRFRFDRGGEAARATVALARRARELGFNERRAHDLEGRRRLRQRLALASAREELAPAIERLYRSQVTERNVPLAGLFWRHDRNQLDGSQLSEREIFVAVPWPRRDGPHPLSHDEAATDFLRFSYLESERRISSGFATEGSVLAVDVSLRRELELRLAWSEPAGTGLQFALETQERPSFSARLLYRRGI